MAQIPVEFFAGDKKAGIDIMFFRFIKESDEKNSDFLFFSRARGVADYQMTKSTNLPSFGLTEAISYNPKAFYGFAPVAVLQFFNSGVFPKAGVQYALQKKNLTLFTWLVTETLKDPNMDYFLLLRYTPALNDHINLYTQLECNNTLPLQQQNKYNFVQRLRLGMMLQQWQFGLAADFSQNGRGTFITTTNTGIFLRMEL
jgi:hypothetical protein